jgi:hypothetical protein
MFGNSTAGWTVFTISGFPKIPSAGTALYRHLQKIEKHRIEIPFIILKAEPMKMRLFFTSLFLTLLSACTSGSDSSNSANMLGNSGSASAENTPIIDNEDLTPGLKGVDANGNGIRDDIDRLIALKYSTTPAMKRASELTALSLQKAMEAKTREEAKIAGDEIFQAGHCVFKAFPHGKPGDIKFQEQMSTEIEALTANTKERFKAYWNGEKLAGGMVFKYPKVSSCE